MIFRDVLTMWNLRMDMVDIARELNIKEHEACALLRAAKTQFRNTNSAADIRPKPPGSSPRQGAVPAASGPGGTLLSEKQPAE